MSESYREIIQKFVPDLDPGTIEIDREGLTNDVIIVNRTLVFRFPKNQTWAKELLRQELKIIQLVRAQVNLPLPQFEHISEDFFVYRYIDGVPLSRDLLLSLTEEDQESIIAQLATFLRIFHNFPMAELTANGIAPSDVNRDRTVWLKLFEDVERELFPYLWSNSKEWVFRHFEPLINNPDFMKYQPKLINGDFTSYHILFDTAQKRINGVIDFGTCGLGDPAADFACVIHYYGETVLQKMAKYYGDIDSFIDRARFWAGTLELQWALRGVRTGEFKWFMVHIGSAHDIKPYSC